MATGERLESLTQFYSTANKLLQHWEPKSGIRHVGDVALSERSATVTIAGKEILLSPVQNALFKMLVRNAENVSTSEILCQFFDESSEWLRNCISALRHKLGQNLRTRIVTVKGEGYMYSLGAVRTVIVALGS
jgi:DNA-binding response OmpR family regulator